MAFLYFWQLFFIYVTEDFLTGTTFRYCIIVHASFFLVLGLCYATSAIAVLFRDLNQIIGIGLQVGVWLTPIMWVSESMIGTNSLLYKILQLNPVFYIVSGYRDAFIIKRWFFERPVWTLYFWIFAICCFLFGNWIFKRLRVHLQMFCK